MLFALQPHVPLASRLEKLKSNIGQEVEKLQAGGQETRRDMCERTQWSLPQSFGA